jgi:hypothetical protein
MRRPPFAAIVAAMNTRTLTLMTALALAVAVAPASASAKGCSGKTKGGSSITFKLKGKKVSRINTAVPTVCMESTGSYKSRAGAELFQPPGTFKLGKTTQTKALQPAAMNSGTDATKTYTVDLGGKGKGGKVKGNLRVSFSFIRPGLTIYDMEIWLCTGTTGFSAKPR